MLEVTIKRKGSLLSRLLQREITERQADAIREIVENPDAYVIMKDAPQSIGFGAPHKGEVGNAR